MLEAFKVLKMDSEQFENLEKTGELEDDDEDVGLTLDCIPKLANLDKDILRRLCEAKMLHYERLLPDEESMLNRYPLSNMNNCLVYLL